MRALSSVPITRLRDHVVSRGVHALTLDEVVDLTGLSRSAATEAMRRVRVAGHFFAPVPGLYIAIPSHYATWGVVPAMDFIDDMMRTLGRSYYVALLSAAELHGAAHQRPQVFQVMVDRAVADRDFGRVRLRFYERTGVEDVPVVEMNSATGRVRVSTPEVTAYDLVMRPNVAGALSNMATVVGELVLDGKLDSATLIDVAEGYPLAASRRLGWLLDRLVGEVDTARLSDALARFVSVREQPGRRAVDRLDAAGVRRGPTNRRWGLVENIEVEPDL